VGRPCGVWGQLHRWGADREGTGGGPQSVDEDLADDISMLSTSEETSSSLGAADEDIISRVRAV
jgi:hypothetical protein